MSSKPNFWTKLTKKQQKEAIWSIVITVGIILGTFGVMALVKVGLNTDYPLVVVTSGSMEPTISRGDLLIVKGKPPVNIETGTHEDKLGDIIIYDTNGVWDSPIEDPVVHRVVGKHFNYTDGKYYFITQGDANGDTDPPNGPFGTEIPVPQDKVLGVVVSIIPKIGHVKIFLDTSGLSTILIVVLAFLLVISIVYDITHPEDEEKKKKAGKKGKAENDQNPSESDEPAFIATESNSNNEPFT